MTNILVYRNLIVPKSEIAFLRRQYIGFTRLTPHWVVCKMNEFAPRLTEDPILIGGKGLGGVVGRTLFKQLGIVPPSLEIAALAPKLIHAQFGHGGAQALPLARFLGIPLAVTFHGGDASKEKHYKKRLIPRLYQRRLAALKEEARVFICVSETIRTRLIERGFPQEKLIVNAIGVEMPPPPAPARNEKHLLFIGRFVAKKGIPILMEAMRNLRKAGVTTPLVMIGDGPLLEETKQDAADISGLSFLGWQERDAICQAMENAYAALIPSVRAPNGDSEGLPSVAAEAMSYGVPVIATDEAGLQGVVVDRRDGRIVPARNAAAFADAIKDLLDNPAEREAIGLAGRKTAERELSAEAQSRKLEDILLGLI